MSRRAALHPSANSAQLAKWKHSYDLINKLPYPNELFNGPVYRQ